MWVEKSLLRIDETEFELHDLVTPLQIHEHFDLVISLEVAEHIPASCAETFIDSITKLGPVVLFSAAIPFQGGTITLKKSGRNTGPKLFSKRGFLLVDCIRKRIWNMDGVAAYFAQNMLFFVKKEHLKFLSCIEQRVQERPCVPTFNNSSSKISRSNGSQ